MKYFKNINTLEELRSQYKKLLKKYHPDNKNGSTEAAQAINAEYEKLFKALKNRHDSNAADSKPGCSGNTESAYSNAYDWENDKALRETLEKIISFNGIDIEIIGQWIWVSGNTYAYKKELKECGFKWASQKKMWYWRTDAYRKTSRKTLSMDDIRNYYGSTKVQTKYKPLLQA